MGKGKPCDSRSLFSRMSPEETAIQARLATTAITSCRAGQAGRARRDGGEVSAVGSRGRRRERPRRPRMPAPESLRAGRSASQHTLPHTAHPRGSKEAEVVSVAAAAARRQPLPRRAGSWRAGGPHAVCPPLNCVTCGCCRRPGGSLACGATPS